MVDEDRTFDKKLPDELKAEPETHWWTDTKEFDPWLADDASADIVPEDPLSTSPTQLDSLKIRLDCIKDSHALLRQFTPRELKVLMTLKRNTSTKAWSLREDLVVLSMPASNREIAEVLKDRNKEAVKKRLQLLKSKGLAKRQPEFDTPNS
ncbi:MAG: hypothetical protein WCG29_05825 [Desulfomonile sp.]|nr:hypothetical protein [Deltaproteobacteria bacterium]